MNKPTRLAVPFMLLFACAELSQLGPLTTNVPRPNPPNLSVRGVSMVAAPSNELLAMHFCPLIASPLICRLLGPTPRPDQLKFVFDLTLVAENPNDIPLPAVEAMVAFTAFPESQGQSQVGAVCVLLCEDGTACGPPPQNGCRGGGRELRTMDDYAHATAGFLVALALGQKSLSDISVRTLPPRQPIAITIRLELAPMQVLRLLRTLSEQAIASVKRGKVPRFSLPYALSGTVWVNVQSFGRIAASFGPIDGAFNFDRLIRKL